MTMIGVQHLRQKLPEGPKLGQCIDFKSLFDLLISKIQEFLAICNTWQGKPQLRPGLHLAYTHRRKVEQQLNLVL